MIDSNQETNEALHEEHADDLVKLSADVYDPCYLIQSQGDRIYGLEVITLYEALIL